MSSDAVHVTSAQLLCEAAAVEMAMTPCYAAFAGLKATASLVSLHAPHPHGLAQDLQSAQALCSCNTTSLMIMVSIDFQKCCFEKA